MASNNKAPREKSLRGVPEKPASDTQNMPLPLLDVSEPAVNELIRSAKKRGYVTLDQINAVLPSKATIPTRSRMSVDAQRDGHQLRRDRGGRAEEGAATGEEEEEEETEGELVEVEHSQFRPRPEKSSPASAPTIRSACICARWARSSCCRARAKSRSRNASRPAARR